MTFIEAILIAVVTIAGILQLLTAIQLVRAINRVSKIANTVQTSVEEIDRYVTQIGSRVYQLESRVL